MDDHPKPNGPTKRHRDYVISLIERLAAAMNVELSAETQEEYYRKLVTTKPEILETAIDMLIENWHEPSKMPPIASVRFCVEECQRRAADYRAHSRMAALLARPADAKPPDTGSDEERRDYAAALMEELRKKLAEGAHQIPAYRETAENYARERNGRTEVPTDPAERKEWATRQARKMGWTE